MAPSFSALRCLIVLRRRIAGPIKGIYQAMQIKKGAALTGNFRPTLPHRQYPLHLRQADSHVSDKCAI